MGRNTAKKVFLVFMILLYIGFGLAAYHLSNQGKIRKAAVPMDEASYFSVYRPVDILPNLRAAIGFFRQGMVRDDGHVYLYVFTEGNASAGHDDTNSEAVSYYLLWNAIVGDKEQFDKELDFVEENMLHPLVGYIRWRMNETGGFPGDGENIASDADLRTIRALLIAEDKWGDARYTAMIDDLATALEKVAVTRQNLFAPYGGILDGEIWVADEVWFSYSDFETFRELSERRGYPWDDIYKNMKRLTLGAQIDKGLYNSVLTREGKYGNSIDNGDYGVNSIWMMVRNAESGDPELMESARLNLEFYKEKMLFDGEVFPSYTSTGDAISPMDTPWAYALIGRAAIALKDWEFADVMMAKLIEHQVLDASSPLYGAFPEGYGSDERVGQFTMQESILTMLDYANNRGAVR